MVSIVSWFIGFVVSMVSWFPRFGGVGSGVSGRPRSVDRSIRL